MSRASAEATVALGARSPMRVLYAAKRSASSRTFSKKSPMANPLGNRRGAFFRVVSPSEYATFVKIDETTRRSMRVCSVLGKRPMPCAMLSSSSRM